MWRFLKAILNCTNCLLIIIDYTLCTVIPCERHDTVRLSWQPQNALINGASDFGGVWIWIGSLCWLGCFYHHGHEVFGSFLPALTAGRRKGPLFAESSDEDGDNLEQKASGTWICFCWPKLCSLNFCLLAIISTEKHEWQNEFRSTFHSLFWRRQAVLPLLWASRCDQHGRILPGTEPLANVVFRGNMA